MQAQIETLTEARRLSDLGREWCVVARQAVADGAALPQWGWTLPEAEVQQFRAERDAGMVETVTGRAGTARMLYARRVQPPARRRVAALDPAAALGAAMDLLRLIADDPLVRGAHRVAARRHLARLAPAAPHVRAAARDDGADEADDTDA